MRRCGVRVSTARWRLSRSTTHPKGPFLRPAARTSQGSGTKPARPETHSSRCSALSSAMAAPKPALPTWPRYDSALRTTMLISQDGHRVERDPRGAQRRLWQGREWSSGTWWSIEGRDVEVDGEAAWSPRKAGCDLAPLIPGCIPTSMSRAGCARPSRPSSYRRCTVRPMHSASVATAWVDTCSTAGVSSPARVNMLGGISSRPCALRTSASSPMGKAGAIGWRVQASLSRCATDARAELPSTHAHYGSTDRFMRARTVRSARAPPPTLRPRESGPSVLRR